MSGHYWTLEWSTHDPNPPPNGKRLLAEIYIPAEKGQGARQPPEFARLHILGDGYHLCWRWIDTDPPKRRPPEVLASIRQKRLRRRIENKYPLFADQFESEAIPAKPEYYIDGKSDYEQERNDILAAEAAERLRITSRPNQLITY